MLLKSFHYLLFLQIFDQLKTVSGGDINNIDIWVGGLLETSKDGPGELFSTIIEDQFRRIRDGDRFWFENKDNKYVTTKAPNNVTLPGHIGW